jgi:hypothetical protein
MIAVIILTMALLIVGIAYLCVQDWIKCQYKDAALWYYRQHKHGEDLGDAIQLIDRLYQNARATVRREASRSSSKLSDIRSHHLPVRADYLLHHRAASAVPARRRCAPHGIGLGTLRALSLARRAPSGSS